MAALTALIERTGPPGGGAGSGGPEGASSSDKPGAGSDVAGPRIPGGHLRKGWSPLHKDAIAAAENAKAQFETDDSQRIRTRSGLA